MTEPTVTPQAQPAPKTKKCPDCGSEVGANEEKCPKDGCGCIFKEAEEEMSVVEKNLARLARKNKEKRGQPSPTPTNQPERKNSIFSSLNRKKK